MLKRSKADDTHLKGAGGGTTLLVVNDDPDACELIARIVESTGRPAARAYDIEGVSSVLAQGALAGVVIDSLSCGVNEAFRMLDDIRSSGPTSDLPVIILASSDTNRLFAYQSGADAYVVRPFHANELIDILHLVLTRSSDQRAAFRNEQLAGDASTG